MTEPAAAEPQRYNKPLPDPTAASRSYWEAAREHKLKIQRSSKTGEHIFYPRATSPFGADDELEWVEVSGRGTVYSYTIARRPTAPAWANDGPYAIAIVQLEEGPKLTANIIDCPVDNVKIGMQLEVTFQDVTPEVTLVQFRPAGPEPPAAEIAPPNTTSNLPS